MRKIILINLFAFIFLISSLEAVFRFSSNRDFHNSFQEYTKIISFDYFAFTASENALFGPMVSHPFFGHTLSPQRGSNNLGFDNNFDFPYKRNKDEFIIGVFGASVAQGLARSLSSRFNQEKVEVCNSKRSVKFINFALGAYRQPQQFNVFHVFGDQVDFAINIDGNNEAIHRGSPGYPTIYPSFYNDLFLLTRQKIKDLQSIYKMQSAQRKIIEISQTYKFLNKSELYYRTNMALLQLLQKSVESSRRSLGNMVGPNPMLPVEIEGLQSVKDWSKYISLQNVVAKQIQTPILFYLQPTQYLEGSKKMNDAEKMIAFHPDESELNRRRKQWSMMVSELPQLKKNGVHVIDITKIFQDITEPLFVDDCCHFLNKGYEIVTDKVVSDIMAALPKINCERLRSKEQNL
jgi:hypothetical protein